MKPERHKGENKMTTQRRAGLGKGLGALLPPTTESSVDKESIKMVSISEISPNPRQPRTEFRQDELNELADSIKEHGVIQPLIVSDNTDGTFSLIAGERRLRAAQLAGLSMVPVVVRQATDKEMLELALIENVQREDLSPLETAEAYRNLEENFNMTHEEISKRVGKNRVSITNTLRLLKLPGEVQQALVNQKITEGHARVLLSLPTAQAQIAAMQVIINRNMNVRQTEEYVRNLVGERQESSQPRVKNALTPEMQEIEDTLMQAIGTRVSLHPGKSGTGTIQIHYYSDEELENLIKKMSS